MATLINELITRIPDKLGGYMYARMVKDLVQSLVTQYPTLDVAVIGSDVISITDGSDLSLLSAEEQDCLNSLIAIITEILTISNIALTFTEIQPLLNFLGQKIVVDFA